MARSIEDYRLYEAIRSQPAALARVLTADEPVEDAAKLLWRARRAFLVGIGTSSNAAQAAAWMLRAAGVDASAWSAADFAQYPPNAGTGDVAVVFTHTGRKRYPKAALRLLAAREVPSIVVTSTETELRPIDGEAGDYAEGTVLLHTTPREQSSMFTVSHTTAMLLMARVADAIRSGSVGDLAAVPGAVAEALEVEPGVAELARAWQRRRAIVALGAGPHEPSAWEAAIKIAEAARRAVRASAVEQFLHGPQVQVQADEAFVVFAGAGPALERTTEAAGFALELGCEVAWVAPQAGPRRSWHLEVPDVGELLAPIVEAVPAQLLAGHLAALADVDGDNFRMDEPAFKAARERIEL